MTCYSYLFLFIERDPPFPAHPQIIVTPDAANAGNPINPKIDVSAVATAATTPIYGSIQL